jgi:hypothetical protein
MYPVSYTYRKDGATALVSRTSCWVMAPNAKKVEFLSLDEMGIVLPISQK